MVQRFLLMRGSCPCFVIFRGVVGAKWEQKPGPARAPSRPWFGSRMSRHGRRHPYSRSHWRVGPWLWVSAGRRGLTDATERFLLARENVLPNSTPLNDPRMLCPRMLRRDDELQPDRGRFTREESWAWPYPERGLSYPSWE